MKMKTRILTACRGRLLAIGLIVSPFILAGCLPQEVVLQPVAGASIVGASTLGLAYVVVASDPSSGPRVTFQNDADIPVQVRYWIGRTDATTPGGVADIRSKSKYAFIVEPGERITTRVGSRPGWTTSSSDLVVWARLDPGDYVVVPEYETTKLWEGSDQPQWYQVTRPLPYGWRAVGAAADLHAVRLGEGQLPPLPRDQWIDGNAGEFPVYATQATSDGIDGAS